MNLFIVLDGPDATGTTTHVRLLTERLRAEGHDVVATSEPTDGPIGKEIRAALKTGHVGPMALQLLFTDDRRWHIDNVIRPALNADKIVVCDRYWHSTIVYAEAQGLDATTLKKMNLAFLQPNLTIFTLPPFETALTRMAKRTSTEIFEKEEFQRKIFAGYRKFADADPTIRTIDTSGAKETSAEMIWNAVCGILKP